MKKLKIKMLLLFVGISISIKVNSATLQQLLTAYCVPPNASGCASNIKANFIGSTFTTDALNKNYCECPEENMYYDTTERICKHCEIGMYSKTKTSTKCDYLVCEMSWVLIKVDNGCPLGYVKVIPN